MKAPPYGVVIGALIAIPAAYAGVVKSESIFAMIKADRAFIAAMVVIFIALLASAYRRTKLEFIGISIFLIGFPYFSLLAANSWTKDQSFVPNDCFTLGDGATGMTLGGIIMLVSYLSQKDIPWSDRKNEDDPAG